MKYYIFYNQRKLMKRKQMTKENVKFGLIGPS